MIFKMDFESNMKEILLNFHELENNRITQVKPNNLKDLLSFLYGHTGIKNSITINVIDNDNAMQYFEIRY